MNFYLHVMNLLNSKEVESNFSCLYKYKFVPKNL